jgi:hypothetical protein
VEFLCGVGTQGCGRDERLTDNDVAQRRVDDAQASTGLHERVLMASVVFVQMAWGASLVYLGLRFL